MALNGNYINNEYTSVKVIDDPELGKLISVKKLLKRTTLRSGNEINTYSAAVIVEHENKGTYPGTSIDLTAGMIFQSTSMNGITVYRIKSHYHKAVLKDSRFRLNSVYQIATQSGPGYTNSGAQTTCNDQHSFTTSYPISGTTYSRNTGFSNWVLNSDGSGGGTIATLTYQRVDTGQIYTVSLPIDL